MTEKSDRVADVVRAAIVRGDYEDGQHLSQTRLAREHAVHHSVVSHALYTLEYEGFVSQDPQRRYRVNASYVTRQLQAVLNKLEDIDWLATGAVVALKGNTMSPMRYARLRDLGSRAARRSGRSRAAHLASVPDQVT